MEEVIEEGYIGNKEPLKIDKNKENIIEKQKKTCICQILIEKIDEQGKNEKKKGTGFFCKIPYKGEMIPVLMTNYHIIDDKFLMENENKNLNIKINERDIKIIKVNKKRKIYSSSNKGGYDLMIIKIEKEDEINNCLELDPNLFNENSEIAYNFNNIYILHYDPDDDKIKFGYCDGFKKINNYDFKHECNTVSGSSGAPLFNFITNRVIGIHKAYIKKEEEKEEGKQKQKYNTATFLKYPLLELQSKINLTVKINKEDINKDIYFLDNSQGFFSENRYIPEHSHLKEINEKNTTLYINEKPYDFKKFFRPIKEGDYTIQIIFHSLINDCSHMFYNCHNITDINLSSFDSQNITNMESMFYGCNNLRNINNFNFNTENVTNMKNMFFGCSNLQSIDLSSFNTENVTNMEGMFAYCCNLKDIDLSKFNINKAQNHLSCMFYYCCNLEKINLTSFNSIEGIFFKCSKLKQISIKKEYYDVIYEQKKRIEGVNDIELKC